MTASAYTEANRKLAASLGWTSIFEVGNSLMGTPPDGAPRSRGQALVPDWCGDWLAAGPLAAQYRLSVACMVKGVSVGGEYQQYAEHTSRDHAVRYLIVLAVTFRREGRARRLAAAEREAR